MTRLEDMPVSFRACGIDMDFIRALNVRAAKGALSDGCMATNPRKADEGQLMEIIEKSSEGRLWQQTLLSAGIDIGERARPQLIHSLPLVNPGSGLCSAGELKSKIKKLFIRAVFIYTAEIPEGN